MTEIISTENNLQIHPFESDLLRVYEDAPSSSLL